MNERRKSCCRCQKTFDPAIDDLYVYRRKGMIFCTQCLATSTCFSCKLPVGNTSLFLSDGLRQVCPTCKPRVVDKTNKPLLHSIRKNIEACMERMFNMHLPRGIFVHLKDPDELTRIDPSKDLLGCFSVERTGKVIYLVTGLLAGDAVAALTHEFVHAWQYQNNLRGKWDDMIHEGFAEWVAYHVTTELKYARAKESIEANFYETYREGFLKLKELEKKMGPAGVMGWIKSGSRVPAENK